MLYLLERSNCFFIVRFFFPPVLLSPVNVLPAKKGQKPNVQFCIDSMLIVMINTHTHTCTVPAYKTAQVAGTPVRAHTARPHRWQVCRSGKDTHIQSRPHRSGKDKYSTNLWPTWSLATTFRGSYVNVWDRRFRRSQWPTCNLIHILTTI